MYYVIMYENYEIIAVNRQINFTNFKSAFNTFLLKDMISNGSKKVQWRLKKIDAIKCLEG